MTLHLFSHPSPEVSPTPGGGPRKSFDILVMMKTFCSISNNHTRTRFSGGKALQNGVPSLEFATIQSGTAPEKLVKLSLFMIFAAVTSERGESQPCASSFLLLFWGGDDDESSAGAGLCHTLSSYVYALNCAILRLSDCL